MTTLAFVCVHNAGRSQMAAGLARALAPPTVRVLSGGTDPAKAVNATVVAVMGERGIDISSAVPHKLTYDEAMSADFFITMGCSPEEACPAGYRGDTRDWQLPDPKGKGIDEIRGIRDEIEIRVAALLAEIAAEAATKRGGRP